MFEGMKLRMKKTQYLISGKEKEYDDLKMLEHWRSKFYTAYAQYNQAERFDQLELIYRGTKTTQKNVNSRSAVTVKKTNNVPNITYELIESKVNTATPEAVVKSKKPGFEDQAKMIQEKIMSDIDELKLDEETDINERNTYVHGISSLMLNWNIKKGNHEFAGEKEFVNHHPKQLVPQQEVFDLDKMDHFFLIGPRTKDSILRQYGIDVTQEGEEHPEVNEVTDDNRNAGTTSGTDNIVDEIVCFYFDEEGDIGKFVFVGQTTLENKPKYFYPRVNVCSTCGENYSQDETECPECQSEKYKTEIIMTETIEEDMELSPIMYNQKRKKLMTAEDGTKYVDTVYEQVVIERNLSAGTEIPIPAPKKIPMALRKNVPLNFSFAGRSDVETIRPQQEAIKKAVSRAEEKTVQGGSIVAMSDKLNKQVTDDVYQVWKGPRAEIEAVKKYDIQADISGDLAFADYNYSVAKSTIGITDAFQGKYDPSAKSGKAKEVQVEQASGRLQGPIKNKFRFYRDLFELMFWFDICFTRESRPYIKQDENGEDVYEEFNRYELLMQDAAGEWYFNTDFMFKAEIGSDLSHDKSWMYDQAMRMYEMGAINNEQLMQILSQLNFPIATRLLEQMKAEDLRVDEITMALSMIQGMVPETALQFIQLSIDEQRSIIQEAMESEMSGVQQGTPNQNQPSQ